MATVTTLSGSSSGGNTARRVPYVVEAYIDMAAAATAKGSALAAADVIEVLDVPADTMVLSAGIETVTATDGTGVALDLGVTGGDVDVYADGFDPTATGYSTVPTVAANAPILFEAADTLDVLIQAATTAPTSGKIRVFAVMVDVDGVGETDEVDRDQLA